MLSWGHVVATTTITTAVVLCAAAATISGSLVGLVFRAAAAAWRQERDAALDKAGRLEDRVGELEGKLNEQAIEIAALKKRTDYEAMAKQSRRDHERIVDSLSSLTRGLQANTTAVEFLLKQAFPSAVLPTELT